MEMNKKPASMYPVNNYKDSLPLNVDDQVLPALKPNAGKNQPDMYAPGEEFNEDEEINGEPIAPAMMAIAAPLIDVFGEPVIRKIFSRTWNLREQGLSEIEEEIMRGYKSNLSDTFMAAITIVKQSISDKIIGVCQRAIQLLINVCNQLTEVKLSPSQLRDTSASAETILQTLVEKLGDNLQKLRASAEDGILAMCLHPDFGTKVCIQSLTQTIKKEVPQPGANTKKTMNGNKQIIGKY